MQPSPQVILYVDYKKITRCLSVGSKVYLDDGLVSLVVESVETDAMICHVENGGIVGNHVGVNLPGAQVDLPAVSKEDVDDLKFALDNDLDMIFASWVQNAEGVLAIRQVLGDKGKHIKIIAKIESEEGVRNADEIIEVADGIMVARGDLGIEIAAEKVFLAQKMLIAKCNRIGKPVICATQMLDSMIYKPRPTRAETSDVANAVLDGADCVMLSGETASGLFPIASVQIMHHIAKEAESAFYQAKFMEEVLKLTPKPMDASSTTAQAAATAANSCHAGAILCLTTSGRSAQLLSRCRPPCPIIAICWTPNVSRFLLLSRGIFPIFCAQVDGLDWAREVDRRVNYGIEVGKDRGFIHSGEFLVVATGWRQGAGTTNTIRIITAV